MENRKIAPRCRIASTVHVSRPNLNSQPRAKRQLLNAKSTMGVFIIIRLFMLVSTICFLLYKSTIHKCTITINLILYISLKNSLIIQEQNTKKNHKRVVVLYVIKNHVNLHKL
jgi:hypothetical protein